MVDFVVVGNFAEVEIEAGQFFEVLKDTQNS